MRQIHLPVWLGQASRPRAGVFAALYAVVVSCRTVLITVVPLEAYYLLGDAQQVSLLYLGISLAGVACSLSLPGLARMVGRRWVYTLAGIAAALAAGLMASRLLPALVAGMVLQVLSVAAFEISLSLYVLDHVPRRELGRFEPFRVFLAAGSFAVGPWLGVWLSETVAPWSPFAASAAVAGLALAALWTLRLRENPAVAPMTRKPPNPLVYLPRFFAQPRLRLSWVLAVARSGWWSMYFIYAPIYAVSGGLDKEVGGALVSLGAGSIFLVPLWGRIGRRIGMRWLLFAGYTLGGIATITAGLVGGWPWLGAGVLLAAAVITGSIDGAGNVPFLRAVRPHERTEMTTVFSTYRDVAQLLPPGVFAVLLKIFALPAVFLTGGAAFLVMARYALYLPRRL